MSSGLDRQALIGIFVAEASEAMTALVSALNPSDGTIPAPKQLQEQYVWAHKVRGAAALYGYQGIAMLGALLESTLEQAVSINAEVWPKAVGTLRGMVDLFQSQLAVIAQGGVEDLMACERWKREVEGILPELHDDGALTSGTSMLSENYLIPTIDPDVLSYFAPEADEYLQAMDSFLQRLQNDAKDPETIQTMVRTAHTLNGSSRTIGFHAIGDIAHPIEGCLIAVRDGRLAVTSALLGSIAKAVSVIRVLMKRDPARVSQLQQDVPEVTHVLERFRDGRADEAAARAITHTVPAVQVATAVMEPPAPPSENEHARPEPEVVVLSDEYLIPHLDPEVLSYFAPEAQEYLESLEAQLLRLEKETHNSDLIHQLFRTAHTLKGSAYTVGFQAIGDLTHYIEDFMGSVRDGKVRILPGHADVLLRAVDVVRLLLRRDPMLLGTLRQRFNSSMAELKRLEASGSGLPSAAEPVSLAPEPVAPATPEQQDADAGKTVDAKAADGKGSDEREVIRVSRDRLERLLNLVGELVIGRGRLEQRLHVLEQLSQQVLGCKNRLIDSVRSFEEKHTFSYQASPSDPSIALSNQAFSGLSDFGSLEFDKYDDFNILARRISEVTADISESMTQLNGSIRRSYDDMSQLQQLTLGMRDEIARARMVPIGTPFTRFRRATREMARTTGKEVTLVTSGEHTEVDTGVVERLVDPLIHLVRNAVYHGIEPAAARIAKGKPAAGTIYLHAAHRGNAVLIEVEDDGAGLDISKIRTKAIERGLIRPEVAKTLPESEVIKFIFMPGFSTADQIGDQAGRGVGMDVVKRVIESMNGHIEVESIRGVGTKFTLHLPLTLLIATALMVRAGEERYAIPLPSVREVTMLMAGSLQRMVDRSILHLSDEAIEVKTLQHVLHQSGQLPESGKPVVIVRTAVGPVGLAVDELLGRQEIVIKPLGTMKSLRLSCFGGATIDPEGRVVLVLDPGRLMSREAPTTAAQSELPDTALLAEPSEPREEAADAKSGDLPLLLIDDSLSIRKFVGRMLETAGYRVDTAVDGEEGLRKAAAQTYRLILTDLEMPKLNGYEVIQALRSRAQTQQTPIIVMTTRAGDKHRQMALSIGASSYIAKPVEERALVQEIERWVGRESTVRNP